MTGDMLDLSKKGKAQKGKKTDELAREDNLRLDARQAMRRFAIAFLRSAFNRVSPPLIPLYARSVDGALSIARITAQGHKV